MRALLSIYGTAIAGLIVILFFAVASPVFATPGNIALILKETSFLAILALGFAIALTTGELDLSIAEVASLSAVLCGLLVHTGHPPALAIAAGLLTGLACGLWNGISVTVLHVPSLIATLGTAAIARGLGFMVTQGVAFVGRWPASFTDVARGTLLGVPNLVWFLTLIAGGSYFLLNWTRAGAHLVATGEATEASRLAGIKTSRMKMLGLVLCGGFAGVTAVFLTSSLSSAAPNMAGDHFLYAIAAVLLGMTMFVPGRPNIIGTLVAALILKALGNGLVLIGAAYYVQDIVLGLIIIGSVALSTSTFTRTTLVKSLNFKT
jgi:ribose transport system permease protein